MMGARVTVNGEILAARYDGVSITALAGLSFDWGRDSIYDDVDPGILRFRVIDRDGSWSTDASRVGQPVTVERTGPDRVIFRGTIASAKPRREKALNPVTLVREPVWIVDVQASSTVADLAMAVFVGDSAASTVEGLGGWSERGPVTRIDLLLAAGASTIIDSVERPPAIVAAEETTSRMRSIDASRAATALEIIEGAYKTRPLGFVDYDPANNAIKLGRLSVASNVVLTYSGGRTTIVIPSGRVIPAARIATAQGYTAETTVANAIDVVEHDYTWYGKDPALSQGSQKRTTYLSRIATALTRRATGRTRRVLKLDASLIELDPSEFLAGSVAAYNRAIPWLLNEVVKIVDSVNNQLRLPVLRFDDRRLPLGDAGLTELIYTPVTQTMPLYLAGSVFNGLQNAGPQYQIIGGTFTYDKGWTHDVTVAPCRTTAREPLTISQLFGNSDATWASFDDSIALNDLSTVTQGLS